MQAVLLSHDEGWTASSLIRHPSMRGSFNEAMLQKFLDGGDLSDTAKVPLAEYLHNGHRTYDAATDRLVSTRTDPPHRLTEVPAQWVHPKSGDRRSDPQLSQRARGVAWSLTREER